MTPILLEFDVLRILSTRKQCASRTFDAVNLGLKYVELLG